MAKKARQRRTARGSRPAGGLPPIGCIEKTDPEWDIAWKALAQRTGDRDYEALDKATGEVWQYMDSYLGAAGWVHEFRHRHHPATGERRYVRIPATARWRPKVIVG